LTSQDGQLSVDLVAAPQSISLRDRTATLLTYNNEMPGPRLEARPGDAVQIRFTNNLSETTNLHYHGLHIPVTGNADNVFLHVPPGETFTYEFTLPDDHPSGTFWYHPHHHGSVAQQVFGGLSGLFIVRGALDEIPEIQAAQDIPLVLKDFDLTRDNTVAAPNPMFRMWGREGALLTVNGQLQPQLSVAQNGLLRLRLLNASASRIYRLQLEDHPFYLIATDGGATAAPIELSELLLSPGERAEVLIQANRRPGQYKLLNLPYDRGIMTMMDGMMGRGMGNRGSMGNMHNMGNMGNMEDLARVNREPQVLATLTYRDRTDPIPLPQQLLPVETLPAPQRTRQFTLDHGMGGMTGSGFLINNKAFDPQRIDTQVQLDTVEDWEIINAAGLDHPFHLHAYPFQVISRNGQPEPYRAWKDTVLVKAYETVKIRVPFRRISGKTVYHCHILDHEDLGMMGIITTV
jgi:FtsP/CotA-like multicopper oxidase with cupredoxin domain